MTPNADTTINRLHPEEQQIITFLKNEKPLLVEEFERCIQKGRDGILSRLISSLLRENIMNHRERALFAAADQPGGLPEDVLQTVNRLQLFKHTGSLFILKFQKLDTKLIVPAEQTASFFRPILSPPFILLKDGNESELKHPNDILQLLLEDGYDGPREHFEMFMDDVANSAANLALAMAFHAQQSGVSTLEAAEASSDHYSFFEQLVIEGHPTHPGAKMRKGLSARENWSYSAEFKETVALTFAAVKNEFVYMKQMECCSWTEDLLTSEPGIKKEADKLLGSDWEGMYTLFPVHPWQAEHILPDLYKRELERGDIVMIPYTSAYVPGMSFRTLFPAAADQHKPHYKLPVSVHLTGEIRTLSEQTIHNGPLMSALISDFVQNDRYIDETRFVPVMEKAGAYFLHPEDVEEDHQTERSESFSFVIRENIESLAEEDEWAIVGSALVSRVHGAASPLIAELIERFKQTHKISGDSAAVTAFLTRYAENMLTGCIPLMVKYGIGVEGHLQNSVIVFKKDGTPDRVLMRDWEGIRVHSKRLANSGVPLSRFHPKSRILVDDMKSVRNKVFYSVVQNHFAEIVLSVSKHFGILEKDLWKVVRDIMVNVFGELMDDAHSCDAAEEDANVFFASEIDYKAVTLMRMTGEAHSYFYTKVDNPMATKTLGRFGS
ncbi:IucA/IucC family protein [Fictibacillus aquaticus]|uniref:IucA/IucC family siderophore biosynthesis protein n=1 Tax=Fictibacillus aquaticus TaxID=2021314 RepID=A0A235F4V9_9BACL|nr:IucA/IucC family protein [Fictibacillus aquaticus]OYD56290.1 hypothetical protein CGZ90_18240 [Fictibacillus aquaticus]